MTRVLSALVLLPVVIGAIWFLPAWCTLVLALIASVLAFVEYSAIAQALGARMLAGTGAAVVAACLTVSTPALGIALMTALILAGALTVATARPGPGALADAAASLFAPIYIGLPLGSLAAVRVDAGREAVLLLLIVIVVSDSAQYYTGRAFGRRPLAPDDQPEENGRGGDWRHGVRDAGVRRGRALSVFALACRVDRAGSAPRLRCWALSAICSSRSSSAARA